jgi:DNA oxidative demethylase
MTVNLFGDAEHGQMWREDLCPGAVVLRGFAVPDATAIFAALHGITIQAPFRHMLTPGGFRMSVAMTNCGASGWVTDRTGYRYDAVDPETGKPWPACRACI